MSKPTPYFTFVANGLQVQFTNQTTGVVTGYLWDFGFTLASVPQTSTDANPSITFPNAGVFTVGLSATNVEGTNVFNFAIVVSNIPNLNSTISELVLGEFPGGLSITANYYNQLVRKWQLYLQASQKISDLDVFDETKWPPMANVLIAKLIVYDLILIAQRSLMTSTSSRGGSSGSFVLLSDYSITLPIVDPITIQSLIINDLVVLGPVTSFTTLEQIKDWLNTLNMGTWVTSGPDILSFGNKNSFSKLTYNVTGDAQAVEVLFTQSNQRISTAAANNTTSGASGIRGAVKSIETGPSKAEWFDMSNFWANIMKNGVLDNSIQEICMFAMQIGVQLYFCPQRKRTKVFIVGHKPSGRCGDC